MERRTASTALVNSATTLSPAALKIRPTNASPPGTRYVCLPVGLVLPPSAQGALYGNALISVHPSRQFLSRSIPEAELAVSEGVFRTPDFGLRTRRCMSGYGYKRRFGPCRRSDRSTPESRPSSGNVCFAPDFVCFTPRCGRPGRCPRRTACDPR